MYLPRLSCIKRVLPLPTDTWANRLWLCQEWNNEKWRGKKKTKTHIKIENKWKLSKINVSASCPEAYSVDKSTGRLPSGRNSRLKIPLLNLESWSSRDNSKSLKYNQSRVLSWGGEGDISHLPVSQIIPVFALPTSTLNSARSLQKTQAFQNHSVLAAICTHRGEVAKLKVSNQNTGCTHTFGSGKWQIDPRASRDLS